MKQWLSEMLSNGAVVGKIMLLVAVPTALLSVHVWNQYRIAEVGYEIAEATAEHRDLLEENKKLSVEARVQGRSDRVAELAQEQFGLQEARPDQIISVDVAEDSGELDDVDAPEHAQLNAADGASQPTPTVQ